MARDQKQQQQAKRRVYKPELGKLISLEPGTYFEGTFQGAKQIEITDRQTGDKKDVMRYTFRDKDGKKSVLLSAYQLDEAFQSIFEAEGGVDGCVGLNMRIERGDDQKLPGKRTMGTYEVSVWED